MVITADDISVKTDHFLGAKFWKNKEKFGQELHDNWTRCGYIRGILCNRWEIHPSGKLRKYRSKAHLKGTSDVGGYPVTGRIVFGRHRVLSMHRISLETYKPKPHPSLECDHRDEVRKNFAIKNLRWVSRALNVTFQTHLGYRTRYYPKGTMYETCFRDQTFGPYKTKAQARDQYLYIRAVWMRNERERLIRMVAEWNSCTRSEAIDMLNWDSRDDVDFLHEL